jgi:hypothetical protein
LNCIFKHAGIGNQWQIAEIDETHFTCLDLSNGSYARDPIDRFLEKIKDPNRTTYIWVKPPIDKWNKHKERMLEAK